MTENNPDHRQPQSFQACLVSVLLVLLPVIAVIATIALLLQ